MLEPKCSVRKSVYAELFHTFNWATKNSYLNDGGASDTGWLQGRTISDSSWELVSGPDSSLTISDSSNTAVLATVKLAGGTLGDDEDNPNEYEVMNKITLTNGEKESRILVVRMRK